MSGGEDTLFDANGEGLKFELVVARGDAEETDLGSRVIRMAVKEYGETGRESTSTGTVGVQPQTKVGSMASGRGWEDIVGE